MIQKLESQDRTRGFSPEQKELVVRGNLAEFLSTKFFSGAEDAGLFKSGDAERIPHIVSDLLASLFSTSDEQELFTEMNLIGSVPKAMVWNSLTGNIPAGFWTLHRFLSGQMGKLKLSENPQVREFASVYDKTPIDLNIKVETSPNSSVRQLASRLTRRFDVSPGDIKSSEFNYPGEKEKITQIEFQFAHRGYLINGRVRPIPSNRHVESLILQIFDEQHVKEKYRIYISEQGRILDKRSGTTTLKQDKCVAQLTYKQGKIMYSVGKDAVNVMQGQDSFDSDSDDPGSLVELFFRGLRQSFLHTLDNPMTHTDYIQLAEGQTLDLPAFDMFFPEYTSGSIFEFRRKLDGLLFKGKLRLPYENKEQMSLLQKECALCLQIDPYMTIQAFRDTGIALAIPGLRHLSDQDWNRILFSLPLSMDLAERTMFPRKLDAAYMARQREIYLGRDKRHPDPHFDGVERFMRALLKIPNGSSDELWEAYLQLWNEPKQLAIHPVTIDGSTIGHELKGQEIVYNGIPIVMFRTDQVNLYGRLVMDALKHVEGLNEEKVQLAWSERKEKALQEINGNSHNAWVSQAISPDATRPLVGERHDQDKKLRSIGYVGAILQSFTAGRTPKELEKLYKQITQDEDVLDFNEAFWELKLTGFITRNEMLRADRHGKLVPLSIYSWKKPSIRTSLSELSVRENLYPYYVKMTNNTLPFINLIRQSQYKGMMDRFSQYHINSSEVVMALNIDEDVVFIPKRHKATFIKDVQTIQDMLTMQHADLDEV